MEAKSLARLLVFVTDRALGRVWCDELGENGFEVIVSIRDDLYPPITDIDAVIIDVTGPDGIKQCAAVREVSDVPILAIGRVESGNDLVDALDAGADSFSSCSSTSREIASRVRALLRRPRLEEQSASPELVRGRFRLDCERRLAWIDEQPLDVQEAEFTILEALLRKPGAVVSRQELTKRCGETNGALDVRVRRLRAALETHDKRRINAVRGVGFRLDMDDVLT